MLDKNLKRKPSNEGEGMYYDNIRYCQTQKNWIAGICEDINLESYDPLDYYSKVSAHLCWKQFYLKQTAINNKILN